MIQKLIWMARLSLTSVGHDCDVICIFHLDRFFFSYLARATRLMFFVEGNLFLKNWVVKQLYLFLFKIYDCCKFGSVTERFYLLAPKRWPRMTNASYLLQSMYILESDYYLIILCPCKKWVCFTNQPPTIPKISCPSEIQQ